MTEMLEINSLFYDFIVVTLLSLIIGLEQRRHHMEEEEGSDLLFGTDRTFTFIGIFGYILYVLEPGSKILFIAGGGVISVLLAIFYKEKIEKRHKFGLTSIIAALITYCLAPLVITQPKWFALLIVVTVLILTEIKTTLFDISKKFDKDEFITLAKFLVIAFIILPNLPKEPLSDKLPLSLYNMWLALVVVSGISYFSYLLRKFVFNTTGIIFTGVLGGLYSSTAVTLLLSRQSQERSSQPNEYAASIIIATAVMYVRVFLFLLIFNSEIAYHSFIYLTVFFVVSILAAFIIYRSKNPSGVLVKMENKNEQNPLEFKMALFFMVFYIVFSFLSHFAEQQFGKSGIHLLSFLAGFADVDSFIMNIVQGKFSISVLFIVVSILLATTSNNIIKMFYGMYFAEKKCKRLLILGFGAIIIVNVLGILYANYSA